MVIVAHPDDAEFGAAGTIATWVKEGWEVYYVICTDASGGGPDDAMDVGHEARLVISNTRKSEQRAACALLVLKEVSFSVSRMAYCSQLLNYGRIFYVGRARLNHTGGLARLLVEYGWRSNPLE